MAAADWAVASAVNDILRKISYEGEPDEEKKRWMGWEREDVFIIPVVRYMLEEMADYVANHPDTGDGSGDALISVDNGYIEHRGGCECDMCEQEREYGPQPPSDPPPDPGTPPVVRQLFREDRNGWRSQHQPSSVWRAISSPSPWPASHCMICEYTVEDIRRRSVEDRCMWRCCGDEADVEPEYICTSCTYNGRVCNCCGVSEEYYKKVRQEEWRDMHGDGYQNTDRWNFHEVDYDIPGGTCEMHLCPDCIEIEHDSDLDSDDMTYIGEFENEDMPEDNSEKMKKIKDAIKGIGEDLFDVQDKLSEGSI